MTTRSNNTFHIERGDLADSSMTRVRGRLTIGGVADCDLWLNGQGIAELQACIERDEGHFYLSNLGAGCKTTLFGLLIEVNRRVRLVNGDEFQIWFGPKQSSQAYLLTISDPTADALKIKVVQDDREAGGRSLTEDQRSDLLERISAADVSVLAQYWEERKQKKAGGPSALRPKALPQHLKSSYHWRPNRDLVRPRSVAICTWALIVLGTFSVVAAYKYKEAFAPGRISVAHATTTLIKEPAIAGQHSGGDCTPCHASWISANNAEKMNAKCAACHQAEGFAATLIPAHREAGITCTTCHGEHRGQDFRPMNGALGSCVKCHKDEHKKIYSEGSVRTPLGTFGYPVVNGLWIWKGLDPEELASKPDLEARLTKSRATPNPSQQSLNAQFHAVHLHRVMSIPEVAGIAGAASGDQVLSCSSCHKTGFTRQDVDRDYPRETCRRCHNTRVFENSLVAGVETPSCTSCHVQHVKDPNWASALRIGAL